MTHVSARMPTGGRQAVAREALDQLASHLGDRLIPPGHEAYDEARTVFNRMVDKRPAAIVRCRGVSDVVHCVRFAQEQALLVAVRGGGHSAAGFGTCDGGLVIDLSPMNAVRVDPARRTARAEGGATWGDLDRETQIFGLAAPGGIVSTTGIGGLTLGGGQGWLRRTYGMTCDNLVSADIVTADGRFLSASESEHPDLFWALKGGGGNFGVVTSFEYRLHPIGPMVAFAGPVYAVEEAPAVLARFREFFAQAPDEINANAVLWTVPEAAPFPEHLHGRNVVIVGGIHAGPASTGENLLRPLRELGKPLMDLSGTIPYTTLQQLFDPFFRKGELLHYWKAIYLDGLEDEVIGEIAARFRGRVSRVSMLSVWPLGGALARVGADETPIGTRSAPYLLEIIGSWQDPAGSQQNIAWVREVFEAMHRFSSGKPNLNFTGLADDTAPLVRAAFGGQYERLTHVKKTYDPANRFRLNQNIAPAS